MNDLSRPATTRVGEPVAAGGLIPHPAFGRDAFACDVDRARQVLADIAHHDDAAIVAACRLLEAKSPDHCDQTLARELRTMLESRA